MTTIILDEYIRPVLVRYIGQYGWSWTMTRRLINMYYGTEYTEKELRALYRQNRKVS